MTADKIARELGIAADAPERVAAGVAYVLGQAADDGNVYLPATELAARSAELLGVNATLALDGIAALRESEQVWVEDGRAPGASLLAEERPVYLIPFYYGEIGVTNRLRRLIEASEDRLAAFQAFNWPAAFAALAHQPVSDAAAPRVALTPQQMQAVQAALDLSRDGADRRAGHRQDDLHPQHHPPGRGRGRAGRARPHPPVARPSVSAKRQDVRRKRSTACWNSSRPKGSRFSATRRTRWKPTW